MIKKNLNSTQLCAFDQYILFWQVGYSHQGDFLFSELNHKIIFAKLVQDLMDYIRLIRDNTPVIYRIGLNGLRLMPLNFAAEGGVHYFWYNFSPFSATYFSPRKGCPRVLKLWTHFFDMGNKFDTPSYLMFFLRAKCMHCPWSWLQNKVSTIFVIIRPSRVQSCTLSQCVTLTHTFWKIIVYPKICFTALKMQKNQTNTENGAAFSARDISVGEGILDHPPQRNVAYRITKF